MSPSPLLQGIDESRLVAVTAAVAAARGSGEALGAPFSAYVLTNCTIDSLGPFLDFHGLRGGIDARVSFGPYNVLHQLLVDPSSDLHKAKPRLLVIALAWEILVPEPDLPAASIIERLESLFRLAAAQTTAAIAVNTFLQPETGYDRAPRDSALAGRIALVNDWIADFVESNRARFFLCDWNQYVRLLGRAQALDTRYWYLAKAPFKPGFLSHYGADLAKISRALLGLNKKVLVVDCDGTLWGGVVGEDGPEGIALHNGDYPGNVFHAVQRQLRELGQRGVLLAICSKNNLSDVTQILENHPHCVLKPTDFAAMRVNWDNKADNIGHLARELNLGLDSFVFLDDSAFEIEMVQTHLPQVECQQVPSPLYLYPEILERLIDRCFYPAAQTAEDAQRQKLYRVRQEAEAAKSEFTDTASYLRSLNLTFDIHPIEPGEVARVAQLTGKTNQFNVRKQIYGEAEIAAALAGDQRAIFVGVVTDRFSELGLTNVCIVDRQNDKEAVIDSFLMSCRVFERKLEQAFLAKVIEALSQRWDIATLHASFVPTAKNAVAERFFEDFGFTASEATADERRYRLDVTAYKPLSYDHIRMI